MKAESLREIGQSLREGEVLVGLSVLEMQRR